MIPTTLSLTTPYIVLSKCSSAVVWCRSRLTEGKDEYDWCHPWQNLPFPLLVKHKENQQQSQLPQTLTLWMAAEFLWPFQWPWEPALPSSCWLCSAYSQFCSIRSFGRDCRTKRITMFSPLPQADLDRIDWNWRISGRLPQIFFPAQLFKCQLIFTGSLSTVLPLHCPSPPLSFPIPPAKPVSLNAN